MSKPHLKAVIFDVGGVVARSPLLAIAAYEREHGLPKDFINVLITRRGDQGAWQRFERGEISLFQFYKGFSEDLSDLKSGVAWYREHCAKRNIRMPFCNGQEQFFFYQTMVACPTLPKTLNVDGRELFGRMMRESATYDEAVVDAIRRIRVAGRHRVIALTNNFNKSVDSLAQSPPPPQYAHLKLEDELEYLGWGKDGSATPPDLRAMFDDFVDSSEIGMRKPELAIYLYACRRNGISPHEAVFLDDMGMNLRAAREIGMETIHVKIGESRKNLKELEEKIGIGLMESVSKL